MILVAGAGIAGLSLARELARSGASVTVLDAGTIACGASGVATSYLEPRLGTTPLRKVEWEAARQWPAFAEELTGETGIDVGYQTAGQIRVALAENEDKFRKDLTTRRAQGWQVEDLEISDLQHLLPPLGKDVQLAALLPQVRWVNGRKVCLALAAQIGQLGGTVLENHRIEKVSANGGSVAVECNQGRRFQGDKLVIALGFDARVISGLPSDFPVSRPVRGVNLTLDLTDRIGPVAHMVKHHRGNFCPREDNRLIVGTTYEPGETSLTVGDEVIEKILQNAEPIFPFVRHCPISDIQAGIRAKVGDGALRLGRSQEQPAIYWSASHAGAGFLRAPVVARELAQLVLGGTRSGFCEPFISC